MADALEALEKLLRDFAVPLAQVSGEKLAEISHRWDNGWRKAPPTDDLLTVLENREVLELVSRPGQRYKGEGGIEAAAVYIQSCWRRYQARTAYLCLCHRKWAVRTIAMALLMRAQLRRVRNALQARCLRQLENYRSRAEVMLLLSDMCRMFVSVFILIYFIAAGELIFGLNKEQSDFQNEDY